jgi:hypothetical protein
MEKQSSGQGPVEANSTGGQGSRRAVAPSNDNDSSPNIIRAFKPRRLRWAENVARMGESRGAYRILVGET